MGFQRVTLQDDTDIGHQPNPVILAGTELPDPGGPALVTAAFDVELIEMGSPNGTFFGFLDGPPLPESAPAASARISTLNDRVTVTQTWLIQGGTALAIKAKVRGDGLYRVHKINTGYTVLPIPNP
ncbi:MAG TPA: hypothetical protein VGS07_22160 [Thermoanaerobaculia bacterium]|nr:hypothetical protein [Thermoanaerobaculia bacterium]